MGNAFEQRQYERIFFSANQHIQGVFSLAQDSSEEFKITIINLSEGGLHFTQNRKGIHDLKAGDVVILRGMRGQEPLNFTQDIKVEVKWILDTDYLEHVGYGCEFLDLTADIQEKIRNVVANGLAEASR